MHSIKRRVALAALLAFCVGGAHAQVSVTSTGTPVTQDFNTLPASGSATWTNNSTLPGWFHARTGTGTTIVANNGSSNAGNLYSYGAGTATDRAIGALGSGNAAVGNLFYGIRLQNNTGETITSLDVSFVGEQWRNSAAAAQTLAFSYLVGSPAVTGSLAEFQSAGTAVAALDFTTPVTGGTAAALDGNAAANRVAVSATITGLNIPNGTEVMLRWADPDHTGADHGLAIDDVSITAHGSGPSLPALNVSDASIAEGDAGTAVAVFTLSLSSPGTGDITFDVATADNNALAGQDYVADAQSYTFPAAAFPVTVHIGVNGDTDVEADETFFLNVSNVTGANAGDVQGQGTIVNDDFTIVPIHDLQGNGATSPYADVAVTTTGIVTGRKGNGFFLQAPDAEVDADPATSEGIFVFTSSAPPAAAAVGSLVRVAGTVKEFVPPSDPGQLPLTEIASVTGVASLSVGNPLPTPVALTTTFPDPAGPLDQLERLEGMRVTAASFTVAGPTQGFTNEANATGTGNGILHAVVTGVARPHREAGIQANDVPPGGGTVPPIPRWDFNPELLTVDSDGLGAAALDLSAGSTIEGLVGPLDYSFRRYTVMRDAAAGVTVTAGPAIQPARVPTADEFTVASYNLERFFDTVNDPAVSETVLTPLAYANRLNKASLGIRDFLHAPDIVGVVEVENLSTLQDLANKLNADAVAASQPDPQYVAYLQEGNDVGGIDVGFLVKTAPMATDAGVVPRVEVLGVTQVGKDATWVQPDTTTATLNDRPPLVLDAVVHYADGRAFPVTAIVVHQRSLNGAETDDASGARIRAKRQAQAEWLANTLQSMQAADPARRIVVVGDFNAFEFNDGLVHAMGVVAGTPSPDNETVVAGDGVDLVNPDLVNLAAFEDEGQHYSFVFGGNAQSLDHALANEALLGATESFDFDHARINADFPEVARSNASSPSRLADHDPLLAYFAMAPLRADLAVTASAGPGGTYGTTATFGASVANAGPDAAEFPGIGFAFDAELPGLAALAPAGWSCGAPVVGGGETTLSCSAAALANDGDALFALSAPTTAAHAGRTIRMVALATSMTQDPVEGNNADAASVAIADAADLAVAWSGAAQQPLSALNATYRAVVRNDGGLAAPQAVVRLGANTPATNVVVRATGWTCVRNNGTTAFQATCATTGPLAPGASAQIELAFRTLVVNRAGLRLVAEVSSAGADPVPANNVATQDVVVR